MTTGTRSAGTGVTRRRDDDVPVPAVGRRTPRDLRALRRVLGALVLVVPATCVAISRVVAPGLLAEDSAGVVGEVLAAPARGEAAVWLGVAGAFTLVPAFLVAARVASRRRPVLALAAAAVNGLAYLGMGVVFAALGPLYLVAADQPGSMRDVVAAYLDAVQASPWGTISALAFILGHLVGGVLLGLALRGTLATWAWVAMSAAMPAHAVVYVGLQSLLLDALAWGLMAAAFAACAVHLLRMPDDEWDLAPLAR